MSSGGSKNTTTTQVSGPPSWAVGSFQDMLNRANQVSSQPYTPYYGPRVADFTNDQYAGFQSIADNAAMAQRLGDTGYAFTQNLIHGANQFNPQQNPYQGAQNQYAGKNPYLDQMVSDSQADVTRAYQNSTLPGMLSQFNAGGAFGGTAMNQAMSQSNQDLAGQLGRVSTTLRNADYDRQAQLAESGLNRNAQLADSYLGRQQSAWAQDVANRQNAVGQIGGVIDSRFAPGKALGNIGAQQQGLLQSALDTGYNDYLDQRGWDANQLGVLANALASIQGGTTQQTGANPNYKSAGQNAAGWAALLASMWGS